MATDEKPRAQISSVAGAHGSTDLTISRLDAAMASNDPKATGIALLASLPASFLGALREKTYMTFPKSHGVDIEFLGYELTHPVPSRELSEALAIVRKTLMGAERAEIVRMLTRVKHKTIRRSESDQDIMAQIVLYADDLQDWPADVVRDVVLRWPSNNDFFPTWQGLEKRMRVWTAKRRAMADFIENLTGEA